jgi:hypothetical protein
VCLRDQSRIVFLPVVLCCQPPPNTGAALDGPEESRDRDQRRDRLGHARAVEGFGPPGGDQRQDDQDHGDLACLDADVEADERQRLLAARQTDLSQRAGEAQAVQQAETEDDGSGRGTGRRRASKRGHSGHGDDRQGDRRFHQSGRRLDDPEGGEGQGQRVGQCEDGGEPDQPAEPGRGDGEGGDEGDVIQTERQDVGEAEG